MSRPFRLFVTFLFIRLSLSLSLFVLTHSSIFIRPDVTDEAPGFGRRVHEQNAENVSSRFGLHRTGSASFQRLFASIGHVFARFAHLLHFQQWPLSHSIGVVHRSIRQTTRNRKCSQTHVQRLLFTLNCPFKVGVNCAGIFSRFTRITVDLRGFPFWNCVVVSRCPKRLHYESNHAV
jgi:hypothetical protein